MLDYLKSIENNTKELLKKDDKNTNWTSVLSLHYKQILFLEHERLIHLLVTLFFGLFTILTLFFAILSQYLLMLIPVGLFLVLLIPYIFHYMSLENGVQRLYKQHEDLCKKVMRRRG